MSNFRVALTRLMTHRLTQLRGQLPPTFAGAPFY
eukprot:COSAG01_NODE_5371_length_4302_cov_2.525577_1_plen_33_part_10